jgi:uncharacterized UPF0160 family protein
MIVVTHSGVFHTDDVAAVAALKFIFDFQLTRTREKSVIEKADIVLDVGGIYDRDTLRFDHHQASGAGKRESEIPYASFGLIWKHFGPQVCQKILGDLEIDFYKVASRVDKTLVVGIDARDNGVRTHEVLLANGPQTVSDLISSFNPNSFENQDFDKKFDEAVSFFQIILKNAVSREAGILYADNEAKSMIQPQKGSKIVVLEKFVSPWAKWVNILVPEALFVVYPDGVGNWKVQAIPISPGKTDFRLKAYLPENWRGLEGSKLIEVTGIEGVIFCHNAGFIMGTKTREEALLCAEVSVMLHENG